MSQQAWVGNTLFVVPDEPVELEPSTWCMLFGVEILDPDGWRGINHKSFDALITFDEFADRVSESTHKTSDTFEKALREKNNVLNSSNRPSTTKEQHMTDQTTQPTPQPATVKVPLKARLRNWRTKHPTLTRIFALLGVFGAGMAAQKVTSERTVVKKDNLIELELEADRSVQSDNSASHAEA